MPRTMRTAFLVVAGLVVAAALVACGFLLGVNPDTRAKLQDLVPQGCAQSSSESEVGYDLQQEVLQKLESSYYKAIDPAAFEEDAIDGIMGALEDPYTVYMDASEYAMFLEDTSGSYSGVGMVVELKNRLVTIVSTFKDSPAERAGIRAGDIIVSVDGESTSGQNLDEVVRGIKGPDGTTVVLSVYRLPVTTTTTVADSEDSSDDETAGDGEANTADVSRLPVGGETLDFTLTRKTIAIPVTEREDLTVLGKTVAHISFFTFSDGSAEALRAEVEQAVGRDRVDAIILDLRSNGGGLLDEAIDVASIFISSGEIVSTEGLHSPEQIYSASGDAFAAVPLYVLTDPFTASASEIVSGALQDYGRAVLVGETTFGKGLVQSLVPLSNGGALKVTTAVYLTPNGRDINDTGIEPDIVAPDDLSTIEEDECVETVLELISGAAAAR